MRLFNHTPRIIGFQIREDGLLSALSSGVQESDTIVCLLNIKDCVIITGCADGSLTSYHSGGIIKRAVDESAPKAAITCMCTTGEDFVVVSGSDDFKLYIWDVSTAGLLGLKGRLQGHTGEVCSVIHIPGLNLIASGSCDTTVRLWSQEDYRCLKVIKAHPHSVRTMCSMSKGNLFITGSNDGELKVWKGVTGTCYQEFQRWPGQNFPVVGHNRRVTAICELDVNSVRLVFVSGSLDGSLMIWKRYGIDSWGRFQLVGHTSQINCITELDDVQLHNSNDPIRRILTASHDTTCRVWDRCNHVCLHVLHGHEGWVNSVMVLGDGRLVSGSMDKTVRVWS